MILRALKYTRYTKDAREWSIVGNGDDFAYFGNINLLVGKNASGKSRTLNVIREIAGLLSGKISLSKANTATQRFELIFEGDKKEYNYFLDFKDRIVVSEILLVDGKEYMNRAKGLFIELAESKNVSISVDDTHLAITATDVNGNIYYKPFVQWGKSLKNYFFSNQIEKAHLVKDYRVIEEKDQDVEDTSILVYTLYMGKKTFGDKFISEVKSCMYELGYSQISDIDIQEAKGGYGICVEEDGRYIVSQRDMSQGMFRALALFIFLTYAHMSNMSVCILVDDMGEGLDFERSKGLIDIVTNKIHNSNIQYFMTTNDRHIMNHIPLRFWSVIEREKNKSIFYDIVNSTEKFDDFKYTGLNNFDFLTTDFYKKGFGNIEEEENG